MNKLREVHPEAKLLTREAACARYSLSWNTISRIAKDAGAVIHVGRAVRLDRNLLDSYFESIAGA